MFFAAKHFDPQLGIDAHTYLAPPGVWPTLHIGIVMDPFDYLPTIQVSPDNPIVKGLSAMDSAMQAGLDTIGQGTAAPEVPAPPGAPAGGGEMPASIPFPLGATVEVAGVRRANAGTGGVDFHILVGAPMPVIKAPGGPQFDDELFMGSRIVLADGEPFSRISVPVLACNIVGLVPPFRKKKAVKPLRLSLMLPTTFNVAIPPQVFVGGPPTISWGAMVQRGLFKALGRAYTRVARRVFKNMPPGLLKCQVLRAEPVDIRDGSVSVTHEDFSIPGRLPLSWTRVYASRDHGLAGHCGHGWQTPADVRLAVEADGLLSLQGPEEFALFPALPQAEGQQVLDVVDGARLMRQGSALVVRFKSGLRYHFEDALSPEGEPQAAALPIARIEDACGNHWRFVRQGGELVRIAESGVNGLPGRSIEVQSRGGYIESMALRDPATGQDHPLVRYRHADGDLLAAIDALGAAREFAYLQHRMARHTDRTGLSFHYAYDEQWRVVHAWGDGGLHDYRFAYNAALRQTEVTNSLGHLTVVKFDEAGLPLAEIDPLDGVTTFEYDDAGRTVAVTAPGGLRTGFTYDARGNLLGVQRPDGSTIGCEYDDEDQLRVIVDPLGHCWQHTNDARGLPASQTDPLGAVTRFEYDAHGQLVRHVNARGAVTQLRYDRYGLPAQMIDALAHVTRFDYDALGRLRTQVNALGQRSRYHCDAKGRLQRITQHDGTQLTCAYDAEDRLARYADENGAVTELTYSGTGLIALRVQPDGHAVRYDYDSEEQLVAVINPRGERHELTRDPLGRIVEEIDYWGQRRRFHYDASGRLLRSIDPMGRTISFRTDAMGRITHKTWPDTWGAGPAGAEDFRYDAAGRLVEARNAHSHFKHRFDALGRLVEEQQGSFRIERAYDAAGNSVERKTSAGNRVAVSYDLLNRPAAIAINDETPITIERNALGQATVEHLSEHVVRTLRYNDQGLLAAQAVAKDGAPLFDTRFDYDAAGNLTRRTDSQQGNDLYTHDPMGRILSHVDPMGRVRHYLNDPAGDRLRTSVRTVAMAQTASGQQQPEHWTREGEHEGWHYVFDRAGNLTSRTQTRAPDQPALHLAWDANQRLTQSRWERGPHHGEVTTYGYDPLGRRVFKRNTTHTTWFFWDGDALLGEACQENAVAPKAKKSPVTSLLERRRQEDAFRQLHAKTREFVLKPGTFEPLALIDKDMPPPSVDTPEDTARVLHYHNAPDGRPLRMTTRDGQIVWAVRYDVWGGIARKDCELLAQPIRCQGQQEDAETGLFYNRHRYFDPITGAYVSADPIGLRGGVNPYAYGCSNPYFWIDPLGLAASCERHLRSIDEQLQQGRRARIDVASKDDAIELLLAYITGPAGRRGAFRNTTDQPLPEGKKSESGSDWLPGGRGAYQREGTYHWDAADPNAKAGDHALEGNHLQIHNFDGKIIRIFFP